MEQEQNRQKSSIDRANDLFNNARGVYKKGKQAKRAIQAIRLTRTIAAASQGIGVGTIIGILLISLLVATFFLTFMGGGAVTGTEAPEEEQLPEEQLPGLDYIIEAPSQVENGETYTYKASGSYNSAEGGKSLDSFVITLLVPTNIVTLGTLPGNYAPPSTSGDYTEYKWDLSDAENLALFNQVADSDPPVYTFSFEVSATPKKDDSIARVTFIIE